MEGMDQLVITDMAGRKVAEYDCRGKSALDVRLSGDKGLYMFKFNGEQNQLFRKVILTE
jgi:hypothetical protein